MLGAVAMAPFTLYLDLPARVSGPVPVTGRVTCSGRPLIDTTICLDRGGLHSAYAQIRADGSFRVINMTLDEDGALPGRYHAHLYTHSRGPEFPSKYRDTETSGIELDVAPGWNHFYIDLSGSPDDSPR
jgi:hypothetical protein